MIERTTNFQEPLSDPLTSGRSFQMLRRKYTRRTFVHGTIGTAALMLSGCSSPLVLSNPSSTVVMRPIIAYYNQPSNYHQSQVKVLSGQGYRLTSLSLYGDPAFPLYAAIWTKRSGPPWQVVHDLTLEQYQEALAQWGKKGFRPTLLTATSNARVTAFAGVFEQGNTTTMVKYNLLANHDTALLNLPFETDRATIQYWNTWAVENHYHLRSGTLYGTSARPLYAVVWEKDEHGVGWSWDAGFYDTPARYQELSQVEVAQWAHPALLIPTSDHHTWSTFHDDDIGPWSAFTDLSSAQYRQHEADLTRQGYYPLSIQGCGEGADIRLAAVFAKSLSAPQHVWTVKGPASFAATRDFDEIMRKYMQKYQIRAGSLAIAHNGKLALMRGYTWSEPGYPLTEPTSLFRVASCSKPLTSILIHQLIEKGMLRLDTPMQQILQLKTPDGSAPRDARFDDILVWHLLSHLGGFDDIYTFDPLFDEEVVAQALGVAFPLTKYQIASFMATQPLTYAPGTRFAYANFGFCLLGLIIEKLTGVPYEEALTHHLYQPLGLSRPRIGGSLLSQQVPGEVRYHAKLPMVRSSAMTAQRPLVPAHYGGLNLSNHDANGGQILAAPDYAKVLTAFDYGYAKPLLQPATAKEMWTEPGVLAGKNILRGWFKGVTSHGHPVVGHDGGFYGTMTVVFRRSDNFSFVVFFNRDFNASVAIDGAGNDLTNALSAAVDAVPVWPDHDLFASAGISAS